MGGYGRLRGLFADFTAELADALEAFGEPDIASQLDVLYVTGRCRCGDEDCGSFYVSDGSPRPPRRGLVNYIANLDTGQIILDVCFGTITYVEVFDRPDVNDITSRLPRAPAQAPRPARYRASIRPFWPDAEARNSNRSS